MKGTKGFTLVELVIVIIIVGILSIVAVPIYRGYTKRAYASEGRALLGSIQTAQKVYYAEWGNYASEASTGQGKLLDVDATKNKYFNTFAVTGSAAATGTWSATVAGKEAAQGLSLTISQAKNATPVLTESGTANN